MNEATLTSAIGSPEPKEILAVVAQNAWLCEF